MSPQGGPDVSVLTLDQHPPAIPRLAAVRASEGEREGSSRVQARSNIEYVGFTSAANVWSGNQISYVLSVKNVYEHALLQDLSNFLNQWTTLSNKKKQM